MWRKRESEREPGRYREEGDKDGQAELQIGGETEIRRYTDRPTARQADRHTYHHTHSHTVRHTHGQTGRLTVPRMHGTVSSEE